MFLLIVGTHVFCHQMSSSLNSVPVAPYLSNLSTCPQPQHTVSFQSMLEEKAQYHHFLLLQSTLEFQTLVGQSLAD